MSYWDDVFKGNQDYLDNRKDPAGFWDTTNHLGTLHEGTAALVEAWDAEHPEYANGWDYGWGTA